MLSLGMIRTGPSAGGLTSPRPKVLGPFTGPCKEPKASTGPNTYKLISFGGLHGSNHTNLQMLVASTAPKFLGP